jgi:hypothetical protein
MSADTLSYRFQQSKGAPVAFAGRLVQPIFQKTLGSGRQAIAVRRLAATTSPVQGLRLKAVKGRIEVNGQDHPEIILWADTSPPVLDLAVACANGCELKCWNVWKYGDIVQAWIGNAGMHVAEADGRVTLACSDGVGDADFADLVVELEFSASLSSPST